MKWIETWMNSPSNKASLGVNPEKTFESCNMAVNQGFALNGDGAHNSASLLPELVEAGVRLLVYAGNAGKFEFLHHLYYRALAFQYSLLFSFSLILCSLCLLSSTNWNNRWSNYNLPEVGGPKFHVCPPCSSSCFSLGARIRRRRCYTLHDERANKKSRKPGSFNLGFLHFLRPSNPFAS